MSNTPPWLARRRSRNSAPATDPFWRRAPFIIGFPIFTALLGASGGVFVARHYGELREAVALQEQLSKAFDQARELLPGVRNRLERVRDRLGDIDGRLAQQDLPAHTRACLNDMKMFATVDLRSIEDLVKALNETLLDPFVGSEKTAASVIETMRNHKLAADVLNDGYIRYQSARVQACIEAGSVVPRDAE